jgi:hypothetical protein
LVRLQRCWRLLSLEIEFLVFLYFSRVACLLKVVVYVHKNMSIRKKFDWLKLRDWPKNFGAL